MTDEFQPRTRGRLDAAIVALCAILERLEGDPALKGLFEEHAEIAKTAFLNSQTSDVTLSEFDRTIAQFRHLLAKTA